MLLVIDVGNTNITLGVFNKDELFGTFRMKTKQPRTSDEYGITLQELVERHGIESSKINAVILASVVPDVMHSLGSAIIKYFGVKPVVVSAGIKTGIRIVTENPRQVGPDRIVDAVGAYTLYGGPAIVVDFGTATTFDVIGPDGTFVYGQIGQTEYIIKRMKEESGYPDAKVIATGGLGKMIANETDMIDVYDSQLTLKGLRFIYEKNKKSK